MGQLPVIEGGVFADDITETGLDHFHGRILQNVHITDNSGRHMGVEGGLHIVGDHCRAYGGVAVHRGSGRYDKIGQMIGKTAVFAQIVDNTGTNADQQLCFRSHRLLDPVNGFFVGDQQAVGTEDDFLLQLIAQDFRHPITAGGVCIFVSYQQNVPVILAQWCQILHRTASYGNVFYGAGVFLAAGTVVNALQKFVDHM